MQVQRALSRVLGMTAVALLAACPETPISSGGSSVGEDEIGSEGPDSTGVDTGGLDTGGDVVEDHRTYFIGESRKFDGGGLCENTNLNTVTATLRNRLDNAGWSGLRFVDDNTWPEDFKEGTLDPLALDGVYGDTARLAIYAGHGNVGLLQWGRPSDNGTCRLGLVQGVRLGTLAGDTAAATMFMTSCTLRTDQLGFVLQGNACRQFFGYHNSPYIGFDEARKVFKRTQDGQRSADAWLDEMEQNAALGKNSPVVYTVGSSPDDAVSVHGMANLATGEGYIENVAEPADNFYFEWLDNGCTSSCGNCPGNSNVPPEVTLGETVPRVKMTRYSRTAADLSDLVAMLLPLFDIDPTAVKEDLDAWASEIVASGDVTYSLLLVDPRIDLSYDPDSDLLRITNRSALASARPKQGETIADDPNLASTLAVEAELVRAHLQTLPDMLDLLDPQVEVSTRAIGFGATRGSQTASIPYEYLFSQQGKIEGLMLVGRSLGIGITRLGELSTLTISAVDAKRAGDARFVEHSQVALDALIADLHSQYPSAVDIEIIEPRVGYALIEGQTSAEVLPSLLVSYVVVFGDGEDRVVSRRFPVKISLTETGAVVESLMTLDPNPEEEGDARASH